MKFDPSGERFFMVVNTKVGVHQSEDAKLLLELDNGSRKRILCASPGDVRFSLYFSLRLYINLCLRISCICLKEVTLRTLSEKDLIFVSFDATSRWY